ncbi:MAG: sugar ABC transporter permease [Bifidobacteriaceae bacterium]|jgi:raffinose/stachyose/melibiose transport system permease protein|nr:sugar ABC transporter permease [Bifidobacteriaceae bacterium]
MTTAPVATGVRRVSLRDAAGAAGGRRPPSPGRRRPEGATASEVGRARRKAVGIGLGFLAPAAAFYLLFVILPWLHSIQISFYDWDGVGEGTWAGLRNYAKVFSEPALVDALTNAVGFILFYTVVPVLLGLILAQIIAARRRRGEGVLRTILFLPQILPLVAVGTVFRYLYGQDGPINQVLTWIGLGGAKRAWLGDFSTAYVAVGIVGTWVTTGLCTVLMLAGIQKIDPELYEAARLDGAGKAAEFRYITAPGLRREVVVASMITMVSALASFDVVYATTMGGPGSVTMVPGVMIYQLVFMANRVGVACALATVLSAFTLCLVAALNRLGRER